MDIRIIRVKFYAKVSQYLLKFSQKVEHLSSICIWKWYNAMKEDPRATPELLDAIHNDPLFNKMFKRFENGQS